MMKRHYQFAGMELSVLMPEERMYEDEYRLGPFAVKTVTDPYIYEFQVVDALEEPVGICIAEDPGYRIYEKDNRRIRYIGSVQHTLDGAYIRVSSVGKEYEVQLLADKFPDRIGTKTVLNSFETLHLIAQAQGFILHCSYIERNGKAILFTAPSETGKSTQAELWKNLRGAEIINGDRAAVRIVDGQIMAEGIPFAGSSKYCRNRNLPIEAIVYLGQNTETSICRINGSQAFLKIWEGISAYFWDKKDVELFSEVVREVVERIPVFHLKCTPDESAVLALEKALEEKRKT